MTIGNRQGILPPMNSTVVTRFAPSPTGYLHVGGARTALFNWLLARHTGGKFLLRIEDTDLARSTEESCRSLLADLQWLGLNWDNAELVYQSKRLPIYNEIIESLIARGLAYKAYETPEELDAQRKIAERARRAYIYRRPQLTDEQMRKYESEGRPSVVRFSMPVKEYRFADVVLGKDIVLESGQVQDFVIRKTDGMPTYHFAVVVDDAAMGITHILRGQEHLLNTVNHIGLQDALGYTRPTYGHLPVILNIDGSKMGKRDRDKKVRLHTVLWMRNAKKTVDDLAALSGLPLDRLNWWLEKADRQLEGPEQKQIMPVINLREADLPEVLVHDFRGNGYIPEVLLNFLALLGWSPGGDRERLSIGEMIELFTLDRIGQSNSKFNRDKLLAFNTEACAALGSTSLVPYFRDYLSVNNDSPLSSASDEKLQKVIEMNAGMHVLREADEKSQFFFIADEKIETAPDAVEKVLIKNDRQGLNALVSAKVALEAVENWTAHEIEAVIKELCTTTNLALGKIAQPLRAAISGTIISPPIFQCLEFLGKSASLARIGRCIEMVGKAG